MKVHIGKEMKKLCRVLLAYKDKQRKILSERLQEDSGLGPLNRNEEQLLYITLLWVWCGRYA